MAMLHIVHTRTLSESLYRSSVVAAIDRPTDRLKCHSRQRLWLIFTVNQLESPPFLFDVLRC